MPGICPPIACSSSESMKLKMRLQLQRGLQPGRRHEGRPPRGGSAAPLPDSLPRAAALPAVARSAFSLLAASFPLRARFAPQPWRPADVATGAVVGGAPLAGRRPWRTIPLQGDRPWLQMYWPGRCRGRALGRCRVPRAAGRPPPVFSWLGCRRGAPPPWKVRRSFARLLVLPLPPGLATSSREWPQEPLVALRFPAESLFAAPVAGLRLPLPAVAPRRLAAQGRQQLLP